ncbi:DUF5707 domain-containing protein [Streptomyces sp. NPDC047043]|uniref:DUF5707 domain-containing protein n=1 Tax=Streptomyces sp. NPDC047043 TaxID=3154497 RepID=UPI0033C2352C
MSKRTLVSSLIGIVTLGGITAGGIAVASANSRPTLDNTSARYVAPSDGRAGSLTFTTDASDDSGIRSLKVLAWPASSKLDPTAAELRHAESATCESLSDAKARCTYTLKVTKTQAADLAKGTWYISTLATAEDGDVSFESRAATFEITR